MAYNIINKKKKYAVLIADLLGYVLCSPITWWIKRNSPPLTGIREILIIRTAYIGDVIMTLPILKPLKELYPGAKLTFLTSSKSKEVLMNHPYIDEILTYDAFWFYPESVSNALKHYFKFLGVLRNRHYDLVIEARADIRDILLLMYPSRSKCRVSYGVGGGGYLLTHTVPFKGKRHRVEYHLDIVRFLRARVDDIRWEMNLTSEEMISGKLILQNEGIAESDRVVGIHPGSRKSLKCWPFQRYAEVGDWVISNYSAKVVFVGSKEEKGLVEEIIARMNNPAINLAGQINWGSMASLMKIFNLFICNDSAPLHIASAFKTPTVAIFGPSKSIETGPYGNLHRVVEKNFPCRYQCDENSCNHKRFHACMKDITVEDVLGAVASLIEEVSKPKPYIYKAVNEIRADQEGN